MAKTQIVIPKLDAIITPVLPTPTSFSILGESIQSFSTKDKLAISFLEDDIDEVKEDFPYSPCSKRFCHV